MKQLSRWTRLKRALGFERPTRTGLRFVPYWPDAALLVRDGWTVAREEDRNRQLGWVWLERLEWPNT